MGGCLSVPDPDHGTGSGGAPMPRSLCRRTLDCFMMCLFSRSCAGEFNNSTVQTTSIPPIDDLDFVPGRQAVSSRDTENLQRGVTAAITGCRDLASDLIHRWDLHLQEKHESETEHRRKLKKALELSDSDDSDNGRSDPLGVLGTGLVENALKGVTATSTSQVSQDCETALIDPKMQELHKSQTGKGKGIMLIDSGNSDNKRLDPLDDNSDNKRSNPLCDTDTSLVENAPKGVTSTSTSQVSQETALIDGLPLDPKMQELNKSQTEMGKGIMLIDSDNSDDKRLDPLDDNSDNKRLNLLGDTDTSLVENAPKGVTAASTSQDSQDSQDSGSDLDGRLDPEMRELNKSQTETGKGILLIDSGNSDDKRLDPLDDNSDNKRSNPLGDTDTSLVENAPKGVTAASTSQDSGSDLDGKLDPEMQELHKLQTGGKTRITLTDSDNSDNKRSDPLGDNSDNKRANPLGDTDTSWMENAPKGVTAGSTSHVSQDRETDLMDMLEQEMLELLKSQTREEKGITLIDSDNSDEKNSNPLDYNSENERSDTLADSDTAMAEHSQKSVTAAIIDGQDSGSYLINMFDLEMQELLKSPTGGKRGITLTDSSNSDNKRSNPLGGASTPLVEELTNAESVTIDDKKGSSALNLNEATEVEGIEVARKNEDPSSATEKNGD